MAYGNNMKLADSFPLRYAIYSGDANQDRIVDAADIQLCDNDVMTSSAGYIRTDFNGDFFADAQDHGVLLIIML